MHSQSNSSLARWIIGSCVLLPRFFPDRSHNLTGYQAHLNLRPSRAHNIPRRDEKLCVSRGPATGHCSIRVWKPNRVGRSPHSITDVPSITTSGQPSRLDLDRSHKRTSSAPFFSSVNHMFYRTLSPRETTVTRRSGFSGSGTERADKLYVHDNVTTLPVT